MDEHGYIKIKARSEEIISLATGEKVSTAELEASVMNYEKVSECAVVGYNSKLRGDAPLAFVVLNVDEDEKDSGDKDEDAEGGDDAGDAKADGEGEAKETPLSEWEI